MKVLVIGSGGREHALVWKIAQSPLVNKIFCAPGNAGTGMMVENVDLAVDNLPGLLAFARKEGIDLTVVGPEIPLSLGIVDLFEDHHLKIFGARKNAALIESSKSFAKEIMLKYGISTAAYEVFTEVEPALNYIEKVGAPIVIKADGLAAGKGVVVARTREEAEASVLEMLAGNALGSTGSHVVIEEFLEGEEASFLAFTDGKRIIPLASAQDHKPVFDDDLGPNTGGMGAYSPAPVVTPAIHEMVMSDVMRKAVDGMAAEGRPYRGVLYAGLMIKDGVVKVLEFNARFGDPECQPLLMRLKSDIVPVLLAVATGDLEGIALEWHDAATICVVMAAGGYPGAYRKGDKISGLEQASGIKDLMVFHAGTALQGGHCVTNGGRILGVTALGATVKDAIDRAYAGVDLISWTGVHYRKDIGKKAINRTGS